MDNTPEYTVSEISGAIKAELESRFDYVRVRGELGRVSRPSSGHIYLDLKDDRAVIAGVIWKGVASKFNVQPEQGLEVIVTGKLTSFPGQSKYQLIIDSLEPSGEGALMALLEARRKQFEQEGLFANNRKTALPFLPEVIGVITSPSGAVIKDILHRIKERFPSRVIIWPVRVQGQECAEEVTKAIEGFNKLTHEKNTPSPKPDLIIIARGGGSIEDLWGFNEENVIRAASQSNIPIISAIGHETDWTLLDLVADKRAPTPTAAAEIAIPVRHDLLLQLRQMEMRQSQALYRKLEENKTRLLAAGRGLPKLTALLMPFRQRLDLVSNKQNGILSSILIAKKNQLDIMSSRFQPRILTQQVSQYDKRIKELEQRIGYNFKIRFQEKKQHIISIKRVLDSLSYRSVLARGYAVVWDKNTNRPVSRKSEIQDNTSLNIEFFDGVFETVSDKKETQPSLSKISVSSGEIHKEKQILRKQRKKNKIPDPGQHDLFD